MEPNLYEAAYSTSGGVARVSDLNLSFSNSKPSSLVLVRLPNVKSSNMFLSILSAVTLLVSEVAAHGAVTSYVIAGKNYPG